MERIKSPEQLSEEGFGYGQQLEMFLSDAVDHFEKLHDFLAVQAEPQEESVISGCKELRAAYRASLKVLARLLQANAAEAKKMLYTRIVSIAQEKDTSFFQKKFGGNGMTARLRAKIWNGTW